MGDASKDAVAAVAKVSGVAGEEEKVEAIERKKNIRMGDLSGGMERWRRAWGPQTRA